MGCTRLNAQDESPISGDGARSYGVVKDNFCVTELEAVWRVGRRESAIWWVRVTQS
jgi:hypothetical protein